MTEGMYHLHVKNISRGDGRSMVACAAYRAGEVLPNELEGRESDFSYKRGVIHGEIITPDVAPAWMSDRAKLWNGVEAVEKRKDSRLAKEIEFSIPRDIPAADRIALIRIYAAIFVAQGCVVDFVIHEDPDDHNPHVHMLLTTREVIADGFGPKLRELDKKSFVTLARKAWAAIANKALGNIGSAARIDHRSHSARGIEQKPTRHRGPDQAERKSRRIRNAELRNETLRSQPVQPQPNPQEPHHRERDIMTKPKPEGQQVPKPDQQEIYGDPELTGWWRELHDKSINGEVMVPYDDRRQDQEILTEGIGEAVANLKSRLQAPSQPSTEQENHQLMQDDIARGEVWTGNNVPEPVPDADGRPVHPDELERERRERS